MIEGYYEDATKKMKKVVKDRENCLYHTYVWYYNSLFSVNRMRDKYINMLKEHPVLLPLYALNYKNSEDGIAVYDSSFQIKVIEAYDKIARIELITSVVHNVRKAVYDVNKMYPTQLQVFDLGDQEYICVLSFTKAMEAFISEKLFCQNLGIKIYNQVSEEIFPNKAKLYLVKKFSSLPQSLSYGDMISEDDTITEAFAIDKSVMELLKKRDKGDAMVIKKLAMTLWSIVIGKTFKQDHLVSAVTTDELQKLPVAIINHDLTKGFAELVNDTKDALDSYNEYAGCSVNDFENELKTTISDSISVLHDFSLFKEYVDLKKLEEGYVIKMPSLAEISAALSINYQYKNGEGAIVYNYSKDVFKDVDLKALHDSFISVLYQVLNKAYGSGEAIKSEEEAVKNVNANNVEGVDKIENVNSNRLQQLMFAAITECGVFNICTSNEKKYVADNANLKTYSMGQNLILPNIKYDTIRIIVDGKVSMERMDKEGYLKPLMLLRKNEIIGFDSLYSPFVSADVYTVTSDKCYLVEIPINVVKQIAATHVGIAFDLMKIVSDRGEKFKKLWMLN